MRRSLFRGTCAPLRSRNRSFLVRKSAERGCKDLIRVARGQLLWTTVPFSQVKVRWGQPAVHFCVEKDQFPPPAHLCVAAIEVFWVEKVLSVATKT